MTELAPHHEFRRPGRTTHYPYHEWVDGQTRIATRGIDFTCEPQNFQHALYLYARTHGYQARTQRLNDDQVAFNFSPNGSSDE